MKGQAALEGTLDLRLLVNADLVHERPRHTHAVRGEVGGVEHDLIDRPADPAL